MSEFRDSQIAGVVRSLGIPEQYGVAARRLLDVGIDISEAEYRAVYAREYPEEDIRKNLFRTDNPKPEPSPRPAPQPPPVPTPKGNQPMSTTPSGLSNIEMSRRVKEILQEIGPGKTYAQALPLFEAKGIKPHASSYARNYKLLFGGSARNPGNGSQPATEPTNGTLPKPTRKVKPSKVRLPQASTPAVNGEIPDAAAALRGLTVAKKWAGGWPGVRALIDAIEEAAKA